jgi:hypothetical protein
MQREGVRWTIRRERFVLLAMIGVFVTALPAVFVLPAERILFNPQAYKRALDETPFYQQYPRYISQALSQGSDRLLPGSGAALLDLLEEAGYEETLRQIFPAGWVRQQAEGLIDQFWAYFNFHSSRLELLVDFRSIKSRLRGEEAEAVAATLVQGLPACTADDLLEFAQQALSGTLEDLPLCRPPEALQGLVYLVVSRTIQTSASAMPDQVDLAAAVRGAAFLAGEPVEAAGRRSFALYRVIRRTSAWLPWLALVLLVLTGVLSYRTRRGLFFWPGASLLLTGVSAAAVALLAGLWSSQFVPLLVGALFDADFTFTGLLTEVFAAVARRFVIVSLLVALALAVIGGAALIVSLVTGRDN